MLRNPSKTANSTANLIGIARHGAGWRASVSQGRHRPLIQRHFSIDTDPREMQAWRADTKAGLHVTRKQRATMGSFAYDAARYLKAVTALTTYKERQREIQLWIDVFGQKDRSRITSADIREQRDTWLTEPRSEKDKRPLAASTVNHRLRALSNLYRVLDGRHAINPVRDVPEVTEPDPRDRALPYDAIVKILAAMPDRGCPVKGETRPTVNLTKIRLTCLAYAPLTPKQLGQLTPADLDLERGVVRVPARHKGAGSKGITLPLLPEALTAFAAFHREHLYGPFSLASAGKSFRRATAKAGLQGVRIYDLRHSFATVAYLATGSLEAVGALLQHRAKSTTRRYALGAEAGVMTAHMARVAAGMTDWHDGQAQNAKTLHKTIQPKRPAVMPRGAKLRQKAAK